MGRSSPPAEDISGFESAPADAGAGPAEDALAAPSAFTSTTLPSGMMAVGASSKSVPFNSSLAAAAAGFFFCA